MNSPSDTIAKLTIVYEDSGGDISQRGVSVTEFNSEYITGLCQLRQRERTFSIERIVSCVDVDTGEVANDVLAHLSARYSRSPQRSADVLYQNHYEALQVLVYVARADGQLREAERNVITAACKVITGDARITDQQAKELIDQVGHPSLHSFKIAVGKVLKRGNETTMKRLLIACRTIVATQKNITATEKEALDYMAKRFPLSA